MVRVRAVFYRRRWLAPGLRRATAIGRGLERCTEQTAVARQTGGALGSESAGDAKDRCGRTEPIRAEAAAARGRGLAKRGELGGVASRGRRAAHQSSVAVCRLLR